MRYMIDKYRKCMNIFNITHTDSPTVTAYPWNEFWEMFFDYIKTCATDGKVITFVFPHV